MSLVFGHDRIDLLNDGQLPGLYVDGGIGDFRHGGIKPYSGEVSRERYEDSKEFLAMFFLEN